jgi:hypothetical protein
LFESAGRRLGMNRFMRRVRGVLGTAVTWSLAWVGLGAGFGALAGLPLSFLLRMALNSSVAGFVAGASFAVILSVAERNNSLEDLSLRRVALWGAGGGLLLSLIPMAFGVPVPYLLGPLVINGGIGAGMATGSVVLARRAAGRRFIPGSSDPLLGLEGEH